MSAPGPLLARLMTLMVLMSMLNLTGCALTDSRQRLSDNSCTQGCQSSCLPETNGSSPPTVKMAAWERCVDPMPLDAVPAPVGTYVQAWQQAQSAAAGQNHWVIERNEWFSGGDQLSPDGTKHLGRIALAMSQNPNWVVVESQPVLLAKDETYNLATQRVNQLQSRRKQAVIDGLMRHGIADAENWVIFAED
ncbi:MAG: hypothetical protein AAFP69_13290, partial [Planctomycetota bacterium]